MKVQHTIIGLTLAFFLLLASPLPAQEAAGDYFNDREPVFSTSPDFSLQFGSSFTTAGSAGNFFRHSIAPQINWGLGRNFHLEVGTIFSTTRTDLMQGTFPFAPHMAGGEQMYAGQGGSLFSSTAYAVGTYQVNPRLSLVGATWIERSEYDMKDSPMNPYAFQQNPRGMMLGFDYRVSENLRFGAEVNFSSGFDPYSPLHFNRSPFGAFHSPMPFHRGGRW